MARFDRYGGAPLERYKEKIKKQRAIRDAGKKIKGKEAKKAEKNGCH